MTSDVFDYGRPVVDSDLLDEDLFPLDKGEIRGCVMCDEDVNCSNGVLAGSGMFNNDANFSNLSCLPLDIHGQRLFKSKEIL